MRKVLIVITTEFFDFGGLTSVMLNYYRKMEKKDLKIDFASTNVPPEDDKSFCYIKETGATYYCLGSRKTNTLFYMENLYYVIRDNRYDVVHVNGNSATMFLDLLVAKMAGCRTRIAHGHTTRSEHPLVHIILRPFLLMSSTHRIAVSDATGKWLYRGNYVTLNNAIDASCYKFNPQVRACLRNEFELEGDYVIGNVGKLYAAKNQKFLIDVLKSLIKDKHNAKLVLAGGGELESELKEYAKQLNLCDKVFFLGMRDDIPEVLQTFDVFLFPSIYEGLGLALIEAQASGLNCIASTAVPIETRVTDNVIYYSLNESADSWARKILEFNECDRSEKSVQAIEAIKRAGYDVVNETCRLASLYMNCM